MKSSDIFYSLTVEDIQEVAEESLERHLSNNELREIIPLVEKRIAWHEIIDDAIRQVVRA